MAQPKAVVKSKVCSECGLDWARHGAKPTLDDCVKLLKADLAKRPSYANISGSSAGGWPFYVNTTHA